MGDISRDPREDVSPEAGIGGFGRDFAPNDREYQAIRVKARKVMEGRDSFTMGELQKVVARFLVGR